MHYALLFFCSLFCNIAANQQLPLCDFTEDKSWIAGDCLQDKKALYATFTPKCEPVPLAEKITINGIKEQPNPLLNQKPFIFKALSNKHLFVLDAKPADIYLVDTKSTDSNTASLLAARNIHDANATDTTAGIVAVDLGSTSTNEKDISGYLFAAVKPHDGNFGQIGSGIALVKIIVDDLKEKKKDKNTGKEVEEIIKRTITLNTFDAITGIKSGNRAFPLDTRDIAENPISINGGLDTIDPHVVDLYWSPQIDRLYVSLAVHTKNNARTDQGACAILVGSVHENKLQFKPISSVLASNNHIIGAMGPDQYASIHKTRVMFTSTGLSYLIIVGGNGKPEETKNLIFALPLVDDKTHDAQGAIGFVNQAQGLLANKSDHPIIREPNIKGSVRNPGTTLKNNIQQPDQLYTTNDSAVKVGGTGRLPGAITDLIAGSDSVFVSVTATDESASGIFYSQPIIDGAGMIAAWTPWKRMTFCQGTVLGFNFNLLNGSIRFFEADEHNNVRLHKILWAQPNDQVITAITPAELPYIQVDPLVKFLNEEFSAENGGLTGLFNFDNTTSGISGAEKNHLLVAIGNKKIALIKRKESQADIIQTFIIDKQLETLGPLNYAEVITHDAQTCLAIGGVNGVALLQPNNGSWTVNGGMPNLDAFEQYSVKKIADCRFVKKIMQDRTTLYILTRDTIYQMALDTLQLTTVFTAKQLNAGSFNDMVVSSGVIAIATTAGLLYGDIVQEITGSTATHTLRQISLPGNNHAITKLYYVSPAGHNDLENTGQLFVLVGSAMENFSAVYRLFIHDDCVEVLPDAFFKGKPAPFMNFGTYRSIFVNNGMSVITAAPRYRHEPFIQIETNGIAAYKVPHGKFMCTVPFRHYSTITAIVQDSSTGNWLIAGDFGVYSQPWITA